MAPSSLRRLILTVSLAAFATLAVAAPLPAPTFDPTNAPIFDPTNAPTSTRPAPTHAPAPPSSSDPCAVLGSKTTATYDDVAACYRHIPYDSAVAAATIKTVHALFDQFYVFRDSALTPGLAAPFSSPPVDIIDVLTKIGTTTYPNDYSFHTAVAEAIASLHDAHAGYNGKCISCMEWFFHS